MNIEQLKNEHRLIDIFVQLAEIPSPSLKEDMLATKIIEIFSIYDINAVQDHYGNIIAHIPAAVEDKDIPPLLLSAHMDVVGGSEDVNVRLSNCKRYIETDKTRTLGADDKFGIAAIIDLAIHLTSLYSEIKHGPIEITFTRDEESGMSGIRNLDTSKLNSQYAIIADGESLGELDVEGAGFTNVYVKVSGGKGGHSGINIQDKTRINAINTLAEYISKIPQGVYKQNEKGVVTSINAGVIIGGTANTFLKETSAYGKNIMNETAQKSLLNVIADEAYASFSIRSSEPANEKELINILKKAAKEINDQKRGFINIDLEIKSHLKPFVKSDDDLLPKIIIQSARQCSIECSPSSFHAGAETHVFSNEKLNAHGQKFKPVIIGLANLKNIHSSDEKLDWKSFIEGRHLLEKIVINFAKHWKSS
ncbi:MAG: M20/M25/M40 family metallo-hydrolase [Candidatus Gastranaerophilaceae bacterium]